MASLRNKPAPPDSDANPSPSPRPAKRTLTLIFVVLALMFAAYLVGGQYARWHAASQPPLIVAKSHATFSPLAGAMNLSGAWSFAGAEWNMKSEAVSADDIEARLAALSSTSLPNDASPNVAPEVLRMIDTFHLQPVEHGGNLVYSYKQQSLKAQLVARKDGDVLKALSYAVVYPAAGHKWKLYELEPKGAKSRESTESHLLPLPNGAKRLGARFADDGRLLLEMITFGTTADELVIKWREAGWEVRPSGLGNSPAFSVLCGRGNDVVYAWSPNLPEALQTLMLVRSPTDTELQAPDLAPTK